MRLDEVTQPASIQSGQQGQSGRSPSVKIVGVGGAGVNAVRRLSQSGLTGLDFLCTNTDAASLAGAGGIKSIALGTQATRGMGAGGDPEIGRRAAEASKDALAAEFRGVDLVFIAAGMGGGTGTGAAPVVAAAARAAGAVTVGVVTTPFRFEGTRRKLTALKGILPLQGQIDTLILVNNQQLTAVASRTTSVQAAFALADQVMGRAIAGVSRIITTPGEVNIDFADIRAILRNGGMGLMGIASAGGERRVVDAARSALTNPLVDMPAKGAKGVLYFITAGPDVTLGEITDAGSYIAGIADPNAHIFFGLNTDAARQPGGEVEVVIIATHLPQEHLIGGPPQVKTSLASAMDPLRSTIPLFQAGSHAPPFLGPQDRDEHPGGTSGRAFGEWPGSRGFS